MPRTARWSSPGGNVRRRLAPALAGLLALAPPCAQAQDGAAESAFETRDWDLARAIWQRQARDGSPRALLGLGNLADLGVFGPRDPAEALRLYRLAAAGGLADGFFNVAALLETEGGAGAAQAPLWYSCAAEAGHPRAQYALGLLHAAGQGVPANPDLARHWLGLAADDVPAAQRALQRLDPGRPGGLAAPRPLGAVLLRRDDAPRACLAWSGPPQPPGTTYRVEFVSGRSQTIEASGGVLTTASAVEVPLPGDSRATLWRVVALADGGGSYRASDWQALDGAAGLEPPVASVSLRTRPGDPAAERLARRLGAQMARSGAIVSYSDAGPDARASSVGFTFAEDAGLAARVAAFVPGDPPVRRTDDAATAPGEVVVTLVFER
jgi:hypothetical protein